MATIKTYICSDYQCRYTLYISERFPVWHPETPTNTKKLTVSPESSQYVIGYRSEMFCRFCKKTVEHTPERVCPRCKQGGIYEEEGGRSCPQCLRGRLLVQNLSEF